MIDENELIELLKVGYKITYDKYIRADVYEKIGLMTEMHYIKRGMKLFEDLSEIDDWIPCSVAYPETFKSYNGTMIYNPVQITYLSYYDGTPMCDGMAVYNKENEEWHWWEDGDYERAVLVEVTAWKPLSEPYQQVNRAVK